MNGSKQVEFRKRPIADDVTHVLVYATAPVSAVVCAFSVTGQETLNPRKLWTQFRQVAGIPQDRFFAYFDGKSLGTGIKVGDVVTPRQPLCLSTAFGVKRPPQSFQYLDPSSFSRHFRAMTAAA
ncbi:hypothetical protein [Rhodococcus sp. no. 34]